MTRSVSRSQNDLSECSASLLTKEDINELIESSLKHFKEQLEEKVNYKLQAYHDQLQAYQDKQNVIEEKMHSLEMDFDVYKRKTDNEMDDLKSKHATLSQNYSALQIQMNNAAKLANDNEQYSRRNNLRILGVYLNEGEKERDAVVRIVNNHLKLTDDNGQRLQLSSHHIEVAHVLPRRTRPTAAANNGSSAKVGPPPIIVRFYNRGIRDKILQARRHLKNKQVSLSDDLTTTNQRLLSKLKSEPIVASAWSWNGKLFYKRKDNELIKRYQLHDPMPII